MTEANRAAPTFHLPSEVARELVEAGVAQSARPSESKDSGATPASLVVLNVVVSVVELTQGTAQVPDVASAIARWRRAGDPAKRYQLLASGPKGSMTFSLDHAPEEAAIGRFILRAVYGIA